MRTEANGGRLLKRAGVRKPLARTGLIWPWSRTPLFPRRRRARFLPPIVCGLIGAAAFVVLTDGGRTARGARPLAEQIDTLLVAAGFGVNEVWLTGHRHTFDADLFTALDLDRTSSLLRFDPRKARDRIEQLSWVETAAITRVFPDQLRVEVKERQPFAVWVTDGREAIVDASGRLLAFVTPGAAAHLPRIRGAEAPSAAAELITALHRHPEITRRLEVADRIGARRWTLRLEPRISVLLPAEGQREALDRLADLHGRQGLLDHGNLVADLRLGNRIAIRRSGLLAGGGPAGMSGGG